MHQKGWLKEVVTPGEDGGLVYAKLGAGLQVAGAGLACAKWVAGLVPELWQPGAGLRQVLEAELNHKGRSGE